MKSNILQYYSKINAAYLHAHAEAGTEFLLQKLDAKRNETLLELGCGTGGTLVKLISRNPHLTLVAMDGSSTMIGKSRSRLRFCGISSRVSLLIADLLDPLPFSDNTFHKVYAESVLGIQNGETLQKIFLEIFRILKPGGKLVLNETVWLAEISAEEIQTINDSCKTTFGIIQANAEFPNRQDWMQLMRSSGFSDVSSKEISKVKNKTPVKFPEFLSKLYTLLGKLRKLNPSMMKEASLYKTGSKTIYENKRYMEGVLFTGLK